MPFLLRTVALIVFVFVAIGSVNFVALIISMFFMITYGFLCLVSFLEHFAGNPSYRPTESQKQDRPEYGADASQKNRGGAKTVAT